MKRRRWLPVVALAALGTSSLMACVLSLDESHGVSLDSGVVTKPDAAVEAAAGGGTVDAVAGDAGVDADADAGPVVYPCGWDGASPAVVVLHGQAYLDHLHVEVTQGRGPRFHVTVMDKYVPPHEADLGMIDFCASGFDDDGSLHSWGFVDGAVAPNYELTYEIAVLSPGGATDPQWRQYEPTITVQGDYDGSPNPEGDAQATCYPDSSCMEIYYNP